MREGKEEDCVCLSKSIFRRRRENVGDNERRFEHLIVAREHIVEIDNEKMKRVCS